MYPRPCVLWWAPLLVAASIFAAADAVAVTGIAAVAAAEAAAATACVAAIAAARLIATNTLWIGGRNRHPTCHRGKAAMAHAYRGYASLLKRQLLPFFAV